jgi:hypothetical protein
MNHQIILLWDEDSDTVTVAHVNEPTKKTAKKGDTITFKAFEGRLAKFSVELTGETNFSPATGRVINDSNPKAIEALGDFPLKCSVTDSSGKRHDNGSGGSTKNPGNP